MNTVILTNNGSIYGKSLIRHLEREGVRLRAVVIIDQPLSYHIKLFELVKKRVGLLQALYFSVEMVLTGLLKPTEKIDYEDFKAEKIHVKGNNSKELVEVLNGLKTDVLVLGQTGIIRKNVIQSANIGVLNAHPAILPNYRGIDCLQWALYNQETEYIGCTVHWVDTGVDTGNIISTKGYEVKPELSIDEMEKELYDLCILELHVVISRLENNPYIPSTPQKKEEGNQYYKMPLQKLMKVKQLLSQKK